MERATGLSIPTTPSPHLVEDVYMRTDSMKSVRHSGEESGPGLQSSQTRIKVPLVCSLVPYSLRAFGIGVEPKSAIIYV